MATEDHNVPTADIDQPIADPISARQVEVLRENAAEFGITLYPMGDPGQGIVHVIGPEQGRTLPGMTIVCGDSHTATHGAFGAWPSGSARARSSTCWPPRRCRSRGRSGCRSSSTASSPPGVTAKDVILAVIGEIGTGGGIGHVIEYRGSAIRGLSMEGRMTVCNMSIEAGARAGLVAPDDTTFAYLEGRPHAPQGEAWDAGARRLAHAAQRRRRALGPRRAHRRHDAAPAGHVGHQPGPGDVDRRRRPVARRLRRRDDPRDRRAGPRLHGPDPGTPMRDIAVDTVFIGSCTNSRIEDLRAAAGVLDGRQVTAARVMVVPGSHAVKAQAEAEGLDRIFPAAGADWREPGCSMCLAMNPDKLAPGERAASTSNRNFEGRQGRGGRTHLVSPAVAAATAVAGHFATPEDLG